MQVGLFILKQNVPKPELNLEPTSPLFCMWAVFHCSGVLTSILSVISLVFQGNLEDPIGHCLQEFSFK